eukprot:1160759-Pelagomonas_calceolata.AAC.4
MQVIRITSKALALGARVVHKMLMVLYRWLGVLPAIGTGSGQPSNPSDVQSQPLCNKPTWHTFLTKSEVETQGVGQGQDLRHFRPRLATFYTVDACAHALIQISPVFWLSDRLQGTSDPLETRMGCVGGLVPKVLRARAHLPGKSGAELETRRVQQLATLWRPGKCSNWPHFGYEVLFGMLPMYAQPSLRPRCVGSGFWRAVTTGSLTKTPGSGHPA